MSQIPYVKTYEIIGYTHSDGYCLCVDHATDLRWSEKQQKFIVVEMKDPGNESGRVQPIFADNETDDTLICDACYTELHAAGKDVHDAIIQEQNIMRRP